MRSPYLGPEKAIRKRCLAEGGKADKPITAQDFLMERLREIGLVKERS